MQIIDLTPNDTSAIKQAATLLLEGFKENWPDSWATMDEALAEIQESFGPERISRIAIDDQATVLGWIGGIRQYDGLVWELHPLVVKREFQRQGFGRALVKDLEQQVAQRGGLTLWLGTDDENGMTSLAGVDLYPDVLSHLVHIKNIKDHPYEFYQKLGFVIVGVLPDANGWGKPDIYMAKRVGV